MCRRRRLEFSATLTKKVNLRGNWEDRKRQRWKEGNRAQRRTACERIVRHKRSVCHHSASLWLIATLTTSSLQTFEACDVLRHLLQQCAYWLPTFRRHLALHSQHSNILAGCLSTKRIVLFTPNRNNHLKQAFLANCLVFICDLLVTLSSQSAFSRKTRKRTSSLKTFDWSTKLLHFLMRISFFNLVAIVQEDAC